MKLLLVLPLALLTLDRHTPGFPAVSQEGTPSQTSPVRIEFVSGDSALPVSVSFRVEAGRIALGARQPSGRVHLSGTEGSFTTPVLLEFYDQPAEIVLRPEVAPAGATLYVRPADTSGAEFRVALGGTMRVAWRGSGGGGLSFSGDTLRLSAP